MSLRNNGTTGAYIGKTTNLPTPAGHTVMMWINRRASLGTWSTFSQYQGTVGEIVMQTSSDGHHFNLYCPASDTQGSDLSQDTWYHIAYTNAGSGSSDLKGYLNGVLDISATGLASGGFGSGSLLYILDDTYGEPINGNIAAIKIYSAVLTAAEIANEMRCYTPIRTLNLNAWLPCFDRTKANNLVDLSQVQSFTETGTAITVEDGPPIPWAPFKRRLILPAAPTGIVATPTTLALVTSPFAPSVLVPRLVIPGTKSLVTATFAPVLKLVVIVPTKSLTTTTFAPTVISPHLVTVPVKSLSLSTFAPVVNLSIIPATQSLTLSTFAPSIVSGKVCVPDTKSLTLTTFAPVVSTPRLCIPGTKSLVTTSFIPVVTAGSGTLATPTTLNLTITTFAPVVSTPRLATPTTLSVTITTFVPVIDAGHDYIPATLHLILTGHAPTVSGQPSVTSYVWERIA